LYCPHCGGDIDAARDQRFCPFCGRPIEARGPHDEKAPFPGSERQYCPWEDQENLGFVQGIVDTVQASMFHPADFFSRMPKTGGYLSPLLYALIVGTVGSMVGFLWGFVIEYPFSSGEHLSGGIAIFAGLAIPVMILAALFISAVVLQVCLFVLGGANENLEATFRVVCYCSGPELLNIIPIVGGLIALVWKIYMTVVGLARVHRISVPIAIVALILPSILCCALAVGALLLALPALGLF